MRQSGILAAAALYGLDHNVDRLVEDQANAAWLASGLADIGLAVSPPESNMVSVRPRRDDRGRVCRALGAEGCVSAPPPAESAWSPTSA
jgi:threonine aldolase